MAMTAEQRAERRLRARIKRFLEDHVEIVIDELLQHAFWPRNLATDKNYSRMADDNRNIVRVIFSADADAWLDIVGDPDDSGTTRFRNYFGGGESPHTRCAILVLARAMILDEEARSQDHRYNHDR